MNLNYFCPHYIQEITQVSYTKITPSQLLNAFNLGMSKWTALYGSHIQGDFLNELIHLLQQADFGVINFSITENQRESIQGIVTSMYEYLNITLPVDKRFNYSDFLEVTDLIDEDSAKNNPVVFIIHDAINLDRTEILPHLAYGLRTVIDKGSSINSIFLGSSPGALEPLFNNSRKPLYKSILIHGMSME